MQGGGGTRGFVHLGVIKALQEKGISMEAILQKIEKLEILKRQYGRLKYKQNDLKAALDKIQTSKLSKSDKFEEEKSEKFPFVIVLKGKREYDKLEERRSLPSINWRRWRTSPSTC